MDETTFLQTYQPLVFSQIKKMIEHERLAHAYLFEGEVGTGKHQLSLWTAKRLFCEQVADNEPCNVCINCTRIAEGIHPDVQIIRPDGQTIKVEQMRTLQKEFTKSGFESRQQIFIIQDAEKMNSSAANSLLKFLEEPPGEFLAILETTAVGRVLPTIQSRCQLIHFTPLAKAQLIQQLVENNVATSTATLLAHLTNSYVKAVEISEDEWFNDAKDVVAKWFQYLVKGDEQAFIYVQKKIVALGKEKQQQQQLLTMLLYFFQEQRTKQLAAQETVVQTNRQSLLILEAQKKLASNVAFQSVCEQLVLKIMYTELNKK